MVQFFSLYLLLIKRWAKDVFLCLFLCATGVAVAICTPPELPPARTQAAAEVATRQQQHTAAAMHAYDAAAMASTHAAAAMHAADAAATMHARERCSGGHACGHTYAVAAAAAATQQTQRMRTRQWRQAAAAQ